MRSTNSTRGVSRLRSLADAIGRAKLALAPASAARLETPFRNFSNNPATAFDAPEPLREAALALLARDGSPPPADAAAPKLKHKKRKTDNRQSKGRKLSYEVMPKLQNFMFPVVPEYPVILTELFASVFGQSTAADGVLAARPASSEAADGVSCLAAGGDAPSAIVGSLFAPTT